VFVAPRHCRFNKSTVQAHRRGGRPPPMRRANPGARPRRNRRPTGTAPRATGSRRLPANQSRQHDPPMNSPPRAGQARPCFLFFVFLSPAVQRPDFRLELDLRKVASRSDPIAGATAARGIRAAPPIRRTVTVARGMDIPKRKISGSAAASQNPEVAHRSLIEGVPCARFARLRSTARYVRCCSHRIDFSHLTVTPRDL
jgi:hypothetical protein